MIRLTPGEIALVAGILRSHAPGREVLVFGSRAGGEPKRYSDLDLAVLGDAPLSVATMAALAEAFSESSLSFKVDVVDWAATGPQFRRIIENQSLPLPLG